MLAENKYGHKVTLMGLECIQTMDTVDIISMETIEHLQTNENGEISNKAKNVIE